ncbi:Na+/H+ antiporter NhaC family protein [Anaerotignum lactatifermentans]|uniref:Na+/H+ antiporter NhaC family protein n=1 Tax=Anaerotignum lactatifermentans TaxID=160404 RepID=A0ABS2G746_9FIRM|nr:Na+/H+ antiporter NhaC family protein [Anaerotignum lactatifermentans]MBM6829103.1 Na+/H+ antiporter NhaC family protein [Anaerotignum lactatifermentans]MBM6877289.1 Na+/H+ antiporter NhaC family protein [Anaerotignum lactatifermentans]MBM6950661.1 Na+/H+ antiporter NhaC family protein [Anaerotignum lactatifermentans]
MFQKKTNWVKFLMVFSAVLLLFTFTALGAEEEAVEHVSNMYATIWSLVPPLVAIILALITKEVFSSLFVGIVTGALFYTNFNVKEAFLVMVTNQTEGGLLSNVADSYNGGILIFLVVLGVLVALMNKAGGSAAYGRWASSVIKTRKGALLSTFLLGVVVFVDDYFNCLTVGSVMRPVTDTHNVSRAKLAYIIDATAAPVCIIAPISSWAAAVSGVVEGYNGLELFIRAIPYNFYALLTIVAMITLTLLNFDFGPMYLHEHNAQVNNDLYTTDARPFENAADVAVTGKGGVIDLVLPVIILIVCCIIGMIYTGGFFDGVSFVDAFAGCDASIALALGSVAALLLTFVLYIPRRVLKFSEFMECLPEGFRAMVPAILILTFAWTLSGITGLLGADVFVAGLLESSKGMVHLLLPVIVFAIAIFLAFSTGTSWGTFGILLPIVVPILDPSSELMVITVAATLAGAVAGDHCSPISDTTIMASTGAQCDHINHVSTQLPYAIMVAIVAAVNYLLAAVIQNWIINLPIAIVSMVLVIVILSKVYKPKIK